MTKQIIDNSLRSIIKNNKIQSRRHVKLTYKKKKH